MPPVLNETSELRRIAVFGGIYSNYLALHAALRDVEKRGVDACFCLGDLGAFGPQRFDPELLQAQTARFVDFKLGQLETARPKINRQK